MNRQKLILLAVAATVAVSACGKKKEPPPPPPPTGAMPPAGGMPQGMPPQGMGPQGMPGAPGANPAMPPVPRKVVVPDEVKKGWKSVVLALTDKKGNKTEDLKVEIGQTVKKGSLEITVDNFLPAFTMSGGDITSKSNNPENPAAHVVVMDNGKQIYAGWLFSMYPQAHPMQNDQWAAVLKDFTKK